MDARMIAILLVAVLTVSITVWDFISKSKEEKIECLINWAKKEVYDAEDLLGSGTGQLKLATVYNLAVKQFPWLVSFMTYDDFNEKVVKPALQWLNTQIANNENIKQLLGLK